MFQTFLAKIKTFLQQNLFVDLSALIIGAAMPLAFAPVNYFWLAILCPALLFFILQHTTLKRAWWRGFIFGMGMLGVGTSWIFVSLYHFTGMPVILAVLITTGFVALSAFFIGLQAWLFVKFFRQYQGVWLAVAFAVCWLAQELFRTYVLTGFPWLLLGYSQISTPLCGFAPIFSVYGVTFFTAFLAALFVLTIQAHRRWWRYALYIIAILLLAVGFAQQRWTMPIGEPLRVNLIQGDVKQAIKWQPEYLQSILQHYQQLTEAHWDADLIVWPEGAIPDVFANQARYFQQLNLQAAQHHTDLIVGVFLTDPMGEYYYNGLKLLGLNSGEYYKRHLVPYGEYMPFETLLKKLFVLFRIPMSTLTPGNSEQPLLLVKGNNVGTYLCYEIVYPMLVRSDLPNANLLLTSTDDSWFGRSWAGKQMLQMAQMRSLETGREQLVVGNDSHTAIINAWGQIVAQTPSYQVAVLSGTVQPYIGNTPWVLVNPLFWLGVLVLLLVWPQFRRNSAKQ